MILIFIIAILLGIIGYLIFHIKHKDDELISLCLDADSLKTKVADLILNQRISAGEYDTVDQQAAIEAAKEEAQIYQKIASVKEGLTQQTYNVLLAYQPSFLLEERTRGHGILEFLFWAYSIGYK